MPGAGPGPAQQLHEPPSLARYFTQPSIERGPPALGPDPATRLLGNFLAVVCESLKVGAITENKLSPNYRQGSTFNQQPAANCTSSLPRNNTEGNVFMSGLTISEENKLKGHYIFYKVNIGSFHCFIYF